MAAVDVSGARTEIHSHCWPSLTLFEAAKSNICYTLIYILSFKAVLENIMLSGKPPYSQLQK